jgi:hypothetical protein
MVARGFDITNIVEALRVAGGVRAGDFENGAWARARAAHLTRYWSGEEAPEGRRAEARVVWDAGGLTVRFDCRQTEPPVVSDAPRLDRKTVGLWERDVCEMFLTPEQGPVKRYAEFEVAPTGEWLDLTVAVGPHVDQHVEPLARGRHLELGVARHVARLTRDEQLAHVALPQS